MTLKKTHVVAHCAANIAKLAINIVDLAIVLGNTLDPIKLFDCDIAINGVFMCSIIDQLLPAQGE
jgi:hypothetical protein